LISRKSGTIIYKKNHEDPEGKQAAREEVYRYLIIKTFGGYYV